MANSLSAKKRIKQNQKRRVINRARKSMVKSQIKRFEDALTSDKPNEATEQFQLLARKLDKVTSTSTMHKNTAARIKSRLARRLNASKTKKA